MASEVINGLFALGGAIVGAIISGLFALIVANRSRSRKEITISRSFPAQIIAVQGEYKDKIKISAFGEEVESLSLSEIYISNTGNLPISKLLIKATSSEDMKLILSDPIDQATEDIRQGTSVSVTNTNCLEVDVDFINPGEEIALRSLYAGENPDWNIETRQEGLKIEYRNDPVSSYSDVLADAVFSAILGGYIMDAVFRAVSAPYREYSDRRMKRISRSDKD